MAVHKVCSAAILERLSPRQRFYAGALLLTLASVIPYLNTLHVPWYFDDLNNIVDNPVVHDLPRAARNVFLERGVATLSFAVNYYFGRLDPFGYHLLNIAIHVACMLAVWSLLRRLLERDSPWALFGALLFALHPLQTQAVTYVVQRMTSLSALFFVTAVLAYLACCDEEGWRRRWLYGAALAFGALAVLTKENAAVLPLVLLAVERLFRPGRSWRQQIASLLPFCLVPLFKVFERLLLPVWRGDADATIRYAVQLQTLQDVSPLKYLFTEFSVIWYYLRLLFVPYGQRLDYGWPVVAKLLTLPNLLALAGLLALAALAWRLRRKYTLTSFGIVWFFVALSVESSVIPLDPIFEHRLYLPSFGFVLVVTDLLRRCAVRRWQVACAAAILLLLALLTWQRNDLWGRPVAFLEDNLRHSPDNVRVMVMLGNAYASEKRPEEALRLVERAMQLNPRYDFAYTALGKMLIDQGRGAEALAPLLRGIEVSPNSVTLHEYLGIAYGQTGDYRQALSYFNRAVQLNPVDASVYTNIGVVHSWLGDDRQAADYFQRSLQLAPESEKTLFNYASTLYNLGDKSAALDALRAVIKVNPEHLDAQYGRGVLALELGFRQEARAALDALVRFDDRVRARELGQLLDGGVPESSR